MDHWDKRLPRPIILRNGERLRTLREVGAAITKHFATVTHSVVLRHAIELLMAAAESGKRADIVAAAEQAERAFDSHRML